LAIGGVILIRPENMFGSQQNKERSEERAERSKKLTPSSLLSQVKRGGER